MERSRLKALEAFRIPGIPFWGDTYRYGACPHCGRCFTAPRDKNAQAALKDSACPFDSAALRRATSHMTGPWYRLPEWDAFLGVAVPAHE